MRHCAVPTPWVLAAVLILPLSAAGQSRPAEGIIRGRVVDHATDLGVSGVQLDLLDARNQTRQRTTSDGGGHFAFHRVAPGRFGLKAGRIGYEQVRTPDWWIEAGDVLSLTVRIHHEAVLLAPLEITARSRSNSPVLAGFYRRLERSVGGVFLTRDEIEARNPERVTDLLRTLPGVRVEASGGAISPRSVSFGRTLPGMGVARDGEICPVQVWVDGTLATRGAAASPDELASPRDLEGIEIYRGMSGVPPEFLTPDARCGVILLWTRRSG